MSVNEYKESKQALRKDRMMRAARARRAKLREEANAAAKGPKVTFVPKTPDPTPCRKKRPLVIQDFDEASPKPFNILAKPTLDFISLEDFAEKAQEWLNSPNKSPRQFRLLCATAIGMGGISMQDIVEKFGNVIRRDVDTSFDGWPLPSPQTQRDLVKIFTEIGEDDFIGEKIPWRHSEAARQNEELHHQHV